METYNLRLVRQYLSTVIIVLTFLTYIALSIVVGDYFRESIKLPLTNGFFAIGLYVLILWKYYDKLLVKYNRTLKITDEYFEFENRTYKWNDVDWYRTDEGSSPVMNGFVVRIKGSSSLSFIVTRKKGEELDNWKNMREEFLKVLSSKNIQARNYYASIV